MISKYLKDFDVIGIINFLESEIETYLSEQLTKLVFE
jgi:hypothetical protein